METLYVWLYQPIFNPKIKGDPGCILQDHLFSLLVQRFPFCRILGFSGLIQGCIHLRVIVSPVVLAALRMEENLQEILRVWVIGNPAQLVHLIRGFGII